MRPLLIGSAVLALALGAQAIAADWPQVLGPGRNGVYGGPALSETWGGTGPRVVWRRQIGQGLINGDLIFVSAEYGPGAGVLRFDGSKLTDVWSSDEALSNHYATSVYAGGHLYGFHGRQEFGQSFRAVEFQTGKVRRSQDRFGAGSVTLAGNRLLILAGNRAGVPCDRRRHVVPGFVLRSAGDEGPRAGAHQDGRRRSI